MPLTSSVRCAGYGAWPVTNISSAWAIRQAEHCLQGMKIHRIRATDTDHQGRVDDAIEGQFHWRQAEGDGQ